MEAPAVNGDIQIIMKKKSLFYPAVTVFLMVLLYLERFLNITIARPRLYFEKRGGAKDFHLTANKLIKNNNKL